jgi:cation transport regulator ChaB
MEAKTMTGETDKKAGDRVRVYHDLQPFLHEMVTSSKEEGETYVGIGGTYYVNPSIDYEKVRDISKNNYITEHIERLRALLFIDRPHYKVVDAEGEEDVDLSRLLAQMADECHLWTAMQQTWVNVTIWGCTIWNPIWKRKGAITFLKELRLLPPESFGPVGAKPTGTQPYIFSELLQGIYLDVDGITPRCVQTQSDGSSIEIKNAKVMKDPISPELAGTSKLIPVVPLITAIDFCYQAQLQFVNRTGAPIMFVRFPKELGGPIVDTDTGGERDDLAYAQLILTNWGKNTAYIIRENMELVILDLKTTTSALDTIQHFEKRLRQYFTPATLIATEGPTLGEGTAAKVDLVHEFIKGNHNWIEQLFMELLSPWLKHNALEEFRIEIDIPEPKPSDTDTNIRVAMAGFQTKALRTNEVRDLLGLEPLDDDELESLAEEYASRQPIPQPGIFKEEAITFPQGQWRPPEAGEDAPEGLQALLNKVYSSCRDAQAEEGGDIEDPKRKAKCARVAWAAAKNAGWQKGADGKWTKAETSKEEERLNTFLEEGEDPELAAELAQIAKKAQTRVYKAYSDELAAQKRTQEGKTE